MEDGLVHRMGRPSWMDHMPDTRTVLIAQALIPLMMAFLMTGIFCLLSIGLDPAMPKRWMLNFATAWPIAFCLSIPVSKLAFGLAFRLAAPRR